MVLQTVYDPNVLQIIKKFVTESARFFGADSRETTELELAIEEAAMLIISAYPDGRQDIFQISAEGTDGLFKLVLNNMGLPVDTEHLPEYTIENPEESIDGLQLHLITNLIDNFYFHNRGSKGWQTVLEKKLAGFRDPASAAQNTENSASRKSVAREKLTVSLATPGDAYEITKLAYYTYHYSFAKTTFYYPELLQKALEQKRIISFIVKNPGGEVVAHCAYLRSSSCSELAEIGGLMSSPAYRRSTAGIRMLRMQYNYLIKNDLGIILTESKLVTCHTGSQRITKGYKLTPFALKISVHEQSDFIDMDNISTRQRETLLCSYWAPHGLKDTIRLYIPEAHAALITSLMALPELPLVIRTETYSPTAEHCRLLIEKHRKEQLAVLEITEFGVNWAAELQKTVYQLAIEQFITFHLSVPASTPVPEGLERELVALGFFFSGIHAKTPQNWLLLYTCLNNQAFDFAEIKLTDPVAISLHAHIRTCYEALGHEPGVLS